MELYYCDPSGGEKGKLVEEDGLLRMGGLVLPIYNIIHFFRIVDIESPRRWLFYGQDIYLLFIYLTYIHLLILMHLCTYLHI